MYINLSRYEKWRRKKISTHLSRLSNALGSSSGMWMGVPFFDQGSRSIASNTGYWHSTSMWAGNLQHSGPPTKNMTSLPVSLLYKFFHLEHTTANVTYFNVLFIQSFLWFLYHPIVHIISYTLSSSISALIHG